MAPQTQSFANHAQYTPLYHFFASPLALVFLVWSVTRFFANPGFDTAYFVVGALALFGITAVGRLSPLRVQDRLIRLEEQLRYARLLTPTLAAQAEATFTPRHYVALRFASDAELPALVQQVIANPAMKSREIKQQIRNWRGDYFRA